MKWGIVALVVAVLLLHQDFWNWTDKTLIFGVLPVGLAYHAGYSILASVTMALLVKFLWPTHLEHEETLGQPEPATPVTPAEMAAREELK
ncbi:MAG: hypothetical protein OHK0029_38630 [Armatimonadaceae bacterium]